MQSFKLLFPCFVLGIMLFTGCNNRQPAEESMVSTADTTTFASVISRFKQTFNDAALLSAIPGRYGEYTEEQIALCKIDSLSFILLMQDTTKTYYAEEGFYEGTFLRAVVDSYSHFTLLCLQHNMGDAGNTYTLTTYTKAGVKIANILAAESSGEESEFAFYLKSVLQNDTLIRYETHCRYVEGNPICDSFRRYSLLNKSGAFIEFKADSVLDSRLDTIRKEVFNY